MPTKVHLDPYDISTGLQIRLVDAFDPENEESVELQEVFNQNDELDQPFYSYDLSDEDLKWTKLAVKVEVRMPLDELRAVLPATAQVRDDTILVVSIQCESTKFREAHELPSQGDGFWEGTFTILRALSRGTVRIAPYVCRKTSRPDPDTNSVAVEQHALIASGQPLRIFVDEANFTFKGDIDFKWEDFRESDNSWRRAHASDIYYLDTSRSRPLLFVNSRYKKLRSALQETSRHGVDAVVRYLANAGIAQAVWTQLYLTALGGIDYEEETGDAHPPSEEWKAHAVRRLGSSLIPEQSEHDRLRSLAQQFRSPDRLPALMSKIGTAVQETVRSYKLLESAIKAGEKGETQ